MARQIPLDLGGNLGVGYTYASNRLSSTKYSVLTWFPLSLMNQLKNLINLFYLLNGVLQAIPRFSTNSPLSSFIPVTWIMLCSMLFELAADLRRHGEDQKANQFRVERATL